MTEKKKYWPSGFILFEQNQKQKKVIDVFHFFIAMILHAMNLGNDQIFSHVSQLRSRCSQVF